MRNIFVIAVVSIVSWSGSARGQQMTPQVMATVATKDALVTGGLEVKGDRARLMTNASVTAYDRTAAVSLDRGGEVLVCATSQFHLLHSGTGKSLLFGLDRGALELHGETDVRDVILTPDIRFTIEAAGSYDLRLRVTRNGDTCVENAGKKAPVLMLNDSFSRASYRLIPGQHVLFERGSLREVVDNERSSCGCPGVSTPVQLAANASAAEKALAANPFPAAASEGLAATQPVDNNAPAGEKQTQISTTFTYGAGQGPPPSTMDTTGNGAADAGGESPAPARNKRSFGRKFRHFFYRMFHPDK
jgi:hypothetical protein